MCLLSNRSQMMSKRGKNKKVAHKAQLSVSLMLFISDLKRPAAIKNLFVLFDKKQNVVNGVVIYVPILQ